MKIEIIGAESMGVRSLCCLVRLPNRCIVIDPGLALGYMRHGLQPHPLQVAVGSSVREKILQVLNIATDVVFSHYHGDHIPLVNANPYQLSIRSLSPHFRELSCWSKSADGLSADMNKRLRDLQDLMGTNLQSAEGLSEGRLSFSQAVPHGAAGSKMGTVMMTRIEMDDQVFVHASDIQLLDETTVEQIIEWQANIVLAAGPPLYLSRLTKDERERAWCNALRLIKNIDVVILDHHLMRSMEGAVWLDELSAAVGKKVYCAADFMGRPRRLLEAERAQLYEQMPVPDGWHDNYAKGRVDIDTYCDVIDHQSE
jgi:predicted metallo-beta-lactamase superfamily hydrolase